MLPHWINFITDYNSPIQLALFVVLLYIFWNIENIVGISLQYKKWKHAFLNAGFIFTNIPIMLLLGLLFVKTIHWTQFHHFGILNQLPLSHHLLLLFIASFIFLDLGEYVYHVIMHRVKRLWMFHLVHHSDNVVDVSTTLREHPGENFIRLSFTLLWVFISGTLFWVLLLRQTIQVITTLFAHMNYQLPKKLDKAIGFVFITPNLHHVHHHFQQPYTDCNYGDVLSIWDRLFGTFRTLPQQEIIYGVDTYMDIKEHARFNVLLKLPFGKYRSKNDIILP